MWAYESILYQIYPLGFCGAPFENDGNLEHRILKVKDWIDHLTSLDVDAVLFNPVFESDTHGYNTRDYKQIDCRLGTNADFKEVCDALHEAGIRVILDGVFNHMGRGAAQFQDVVKNREASPYRDWFHISFEGNSNYNDGLWYEGWEGNFDLVKLNLRNPEVCDYLLGCVRFWCDAFGIDGIRLDVAYCLEQDFIRRLRAETEAIAKEKQRDEIFLVGEMIGGDYHRIMGGDLCHAATNYECYKGLYSAFNSRNLFEIIHSLSRQFGPENWTLYKGEHLLSFADNHDVTRIFTILEKPQYLKPLYALMYAMPGIPCLYYGSEWGVAGDKKNGDPSLRPCFEAPEQNDLTDYIAALGEGYHQSKAMWYGDFKSLVLQNTHCVFTRSFEDERILVAVNIDDMEVTVHADFQAGRARDLISGETIDFGGGLRIPPYTAYLLQPY
ncbi:MAG: alpha-glucosidase C-terminal domain-containing protein [Lachnospiraceae bacterium]|nr:alpha-glucosidase C-terminal domain-containing protein [Lachnospiraceae bacterium]